MYYIGQTWAEFRPGPVVHLNLQTPGIRIWSQIAEVDERKAFHARGQSHRRHLQDAGQSSHEHHNSEYTFLLLGGGFKVGRDRLRGDICVCKFGFVFRQFGGHETTTCTRRIAEEAGPNLWKGARVPRRRLNSA